MKLRCPSIPYSVETVAHNLVWLAGAAAFLISPWLAHWYQPLYNNVEVLVERSITSGDSGLLILGAAIFVFLRSATMLTFFWGGLVLGVKLPLSGCPPWARELLLPVALAGAVFVIVSRWSGVPWNYLAPLFALAVALILLPDLLNHYIILPTVVLVQLLLAFVWLDLAPALSRFGFGHGDLPGTIEMAAEFLHAQKVLNLVAIFWFAAFFISAISVAWLVNVSIKNQRRQVELEGLRAQAVETRVEKEMLALVHDLKTPLMTIQGLSSLVAIQVRDEKLGQYADRISGSVDRLSEMISEILHGNVRNMVTVDQLFDYVRAHVLLDAEDPTVVTFTSTAGMPGLRVNHIRMARALINLIENALVAVRGREGATVAVCAEGTDDGRVVLKVADNGQGVEPDYMNQVWEYGYSTGSSGLGLSFVRQVVESNGGTIKLISRPKQGTTAELSFPGGEEG
ncbi:MAG: HAMP domain-containing sensor histidine kinase [Peptococcaceae bacterium]|jgi:signal transduction histidine kinase|nr:HAMP domain-containing sensor histidine kinase [Peptococcaceae bacterium]